MKSLESASRLCSLQARHAASSRGVKVIGRDTRRFEVAAKPDFAGRESFPPVAGGEKGSKNHNKIKKLGTDTMDTIRVGLVGVTGYTGMELARLLAIHPRMRLNVATSRAEAGKRLWEIYPFLRGMPGAEALLIEPDPEAIAAACELAFLAVPHTAATEMAAALLERGCKVVDLSADFRLGDAAVYEQWYKVAHGRPDLLPEAVYGLPELYGPAIAKAELVANPGCYPTSAILGLAAALRAGIIEHDGIIVDSKSGTSGAGRSASVASLFCEVQDTFRAYGVAKHRHTPEIEQEFTALARQADPTIPGLTVTFTPHLVPMNRGILSTIYARLNTPRSQTDVQQLYEQTWQDSPWVRVLPAGSLPETRHVRGTMFCDMAVVVDERAGRLIVVSVIDNLCRGASGQAIANANLMLGLPLTSGLLLPPLMP